MPPGLESKGRRLTIYGEKHSAYLLSAQGHSEALIIHGKEVALDKGTHTRELQSLQVRSEGHEAKADQREDSLRGYCFQLRKQRGSRAHMCRIPDLPVQGFHSHHFFSDPHNSME